MIDFRIGVGNIQDEPGTFCSTESKEVLNKQTKQQEGGDKLEDTGANWKSFQRPNLGQLEQQNKPVLDYNPKYKINSCKSILI